MISYHYAIFVAAFVPGKFPAAAETGGTDVDAVAGLADGIRAFYPDGVGEIATTAVAFDLEARLCHGYQRRVSGGLSEENEGGYSGFLQAAEGVSSCG